MGENAVELTSRLGEPGGAAVSAPPGENWLDEGLEMPDPSLLSDQVYAVLRRAIVEGKIAPGERIVESRIARRLGVSQAPVRDAVKRLVHQGIVSHVPRRGNYLTEVSEEDAEQARQVRTAVEQLAAQLTGTRLTKDDVAELSDVVEQLRVAAAANDVAKFRELDITFHRRVCELSGNKYLVQIWSIMEPVMRGLRAVSDPLFEGDWSAMADEHGRLLEALRAGDPDKASALFAAHSSGDAPVEDRRRRPSSERVARRG